MNKSKKKSSIKIKTEENILKILEEKYGKNFVFQLSDDNKDI